MHPTIPGLKTNSSAVPPPLPMPEIGWSLTAVLDAGTVVLWESRKRRKVGTGDAAVDYAVTVCLGRGD
jgi:hypothetical protein